VAIWIPIWIQGSFFRFVTIARYGKWSMDINLLLIMICQTVALIRRALLEVGTVPVFLVFIVQVHRCFEVPDKSCWDPKLTLITKFAIRFLSAKNLLQKISKLRKLKVKKLRYSNYIHSFNTVGLLCYFNNKWSICWLYNLHSTRLPACWDPKLTPITKLTTLSLLV